MLKRQLVTCRQSISLYTCRLLASGVCTKSVVSGKQCSSEILAVSHCNDEERRQVQARLEQEARLEEEERRLEHELRIRRESQARLERKARREERRQVQARLEQEGRL